MKIELDAVIYYAKRAGLTLTKRNGKLVITRQGPVSDEWIALLTELKPRLLAVVDDAPETVKAPEPTALRYGLKAFPKTGPLNYDMFDGCTLLLPCKRKSPKCPTQADNKKHETKPEPCNC
jgi:hypothetical protein